MTGTRWDLDQRNNISNPDKTPDEVKIHREAQESMDNVRSSTIDSSISSLWTKSDLTIQQQGLEREKNIHSLEWFLSAIDKLLEEIEEIKKWLSKKWLSKEWKKRIDNAKFALNQYEKQLKTKRRALSKYKWEPTIYDEDVKNLQNIKWKVDELKKGIYTKWQWDEPWNPDLPYNSIKNARKSNTRQAESLKLNQQFQEELKIWAIKRIFNWNIQQANDFYRRIAQWEYDQADYQLFVANSAILTPSFQRCGIAVPTNPGWLISRWQTVWWGGEVVTNRPRQSVDYSNMDWWDTFKQWWVSGILDKLLTNCSNMTPWQRDAWKTVGVLGCVAGGIFGLYKFYTNEKMWFWGKAWITAATIFWSQALTWKWPISLFSEWMTWWVSRREMQSWFGDAVGGLDNSRHEIADFTVPAAQSLMVFDEWTTVGNINTMTQGFKNNNQNRTEFYNQSCSKIQRNYWIVAKESFQARFSSNFDEDKREAWLASFWVTSSTSQRENVHELANNAIMNQTIFEKFLSDNKLKITSDSDKKEELDNYIKWKNEKNEAIVLDDLKAHINEWFMVEPDEEQAPDPSQETTPTTPVPNPEIQKEKQIEQAIQNGLERIYTHFEPKIKKINRVPGMKDIKKNDITKRFPELTKIIKSEFIVSESGNTVINIDEAKMWKVFDDFLKKLCTPQSTVPNYVKRAISWKSWDSLKSELKEHKNKRNQKKYNNMRENFTVIFNNIFGPIDSTLRSQNVSPVIKCNWQTFNNVNDAIQSMDVFKI